MSFLSRFNPFRAKGEGRSAKGQGPRAEGGGQRGTAFQQIIRPDARDRWATTALRSFTPEQIENTIRGAMAGHLVAQWELFDLMEATWPRLNTNLNQLKDDVVALEWNVQAWTRKNQDASPEAEKRRDLVEELIWSMSPRPGYDDKDFGDTIRGVLDAVSKGIAVLEIDWERQQSEFGTVIAPARTRWVHPRYYGYPNEGEDRLMLDVREVEARGRRAEGGGQREGQLAEFPANKFVVAIIKTKEGHPVGSSLLRTLGFWWAAINFTGEWLLNYAQLFGQPFRWANYDPNISTSDKNLLADMLENMGSAAWAMFPAGTTLELKEAAGTGKDNPQMAVYRMADTVCDIMIKRQTLTTDVADSGSRALGDVHADVYSKVVKSVAGKAADILSQQLIRPICLLNYGNDFESPWLMPAEEERIDPKEAADRDAVLLGQGVEMPKEWFYNRHNIPMPGPDDDVIQGMATALLDAEKEQAGAQDTRRQTPSPIKGRGMSGRGMVQAKDATDKLIDDVLEDLTGVRAEWLGGVRPFFEGLVQAALSPDFSDAEFERVLIRASAQMPELFRNINVDALADVMDRAMATACVNGAVKGYLKRQRGKRKTESRNQPAT